MRKSSDEEFTYIQAMVANNKTGKRKNDLLNVVLYVTIMCKPESLNLHDRLTKKKTNKKRERMESLEQIQDMFLLCLFFFPSTSALGKHHHLLHSFLVFYHDALYFTFFSPSFLSGEWVFVVCFIFFEFSFFFHSYFVSLLV